MKKKIQWESIHYYIDKSGTLKKDNDEDEEIYYEESDLSEISQINIDELPIILNTPFGMFQVDDAMNPITSFQLWRADTNFDITQSIVETIEKIEGVEALLVFSRYIFYVGVGRLFNFRDVRLQIEKALCESSLNNAKINLIKDEKVKSEVNELIKNIDSNDDWAIYVFPNGAVEYITSKDDKYSETLKLFYDAVKTPKGGGLLFEKNK